MIDGTRQNPVLPQHAQLNLATPRLASNDQGATPALSLKLAMPRCASDDQGETPVNKIWPCLAVRAMIEHKHSSTVLCIV